VPTRAAPTRMSCADRVPLKCIEAPTVLRLPFRRA
jgi:hypothetical protein